MAVEEKEDEQFEFLMQQRNHAQLLDAIGKLREVCGKEQDFSEVVKSIDRNTEAIGKFTEAIGKIKLSAPDVNVQTNQEKVVQAVEKMCQQVCAAVGAIKLTPEQRRKMKFKIKKDWYGNLDDVEVETI